MIQNDLSLSTLVISGVVALCAWGLKETGRTLITTLIKTIAKVEMLDAKLVDVLKLTGHFPKMQSDLNEYYSRLKKLEEKLTAPPQA